MNEYHQAVINLHRECVRDVLLNRIVCFGGDDEFQFLVKHLAEWLEISNDKATEFLWPISHAIYQAAVEVTAEIPQLDESTGKIYPLAKTTGADGKDHGELSKLDTRTGAVTP